MAETLEIGTKVDKWSGYHFPGTIVAKFNTLDGKERYVVEMDEYGLLHIFNRDQLISKELLKNLVDTKVIYRE